MCGIAGYAGPRNGVSVVLDQIKRLEYRGYDSAGVAAVDSEGIQVVKRAGKLGNLATELELHPLCSHLAIAHSRWATHGPPTDLNAHPHFDNEETIAVIHNGIVENYLDLKEKMIEAGHVFRSQTDTEVAAHLIGSEYRHGVSLEQAVLKAAHQLRGSYALVVVSKREPGKIVAVRNASPLVLGIGVGENFLASDIPALLPYTKEVVVMDENTTAVITKDEVKLLDRDGRELPVIKQTIDWDLASAERGGFDHFMIKEIHEQPSVIRQCSSGRIAEDKSVRFEGLFSDHVWNDIDRVNIIACGTAFHSGLMGKYLFEKLLRLPTDVYFSSEFRYGDPVLSQKSLAIFISQSGETADTLAALRLCKTKRIRTLGIVNVAGSSIARECDKTVLTQAGPEISVASTKAYTAQVVTLALLALYIAQVQNMPGVRIDEWVDRFVRMPDCAMGALQLEPDIERLAVEMQAMPLCFFLGRGADAYVASEGALKLKEVAYVPTEESPAGEMKHGPLALIRPGVLAVFGATDPLTIDKIVSNMKEIQARGGTVLAISTDRTEMIQKIADHALFIPSTGSEFLDALLSVIPLQLFAYYVAKARGCEIDQPRNLAKSVTVE